MNAMDDLACCCGCLWACHSQHGQGWARWAVDKFGDQADAADLERKRVRELERARRHWCPPDAHVQRCVVAIC